jgi:hypothetical protein
MSKEAKHSNIAAAFRPQGKPSSVMFLDGLDFGGIPLRDYFAAHATNEDIKPFLPRHSTMQSARAKARYEFADTMIAASGRGK